MSAGDLAREAAIQHAAQEVFALSLELTLDLKIEDAESVARTAITAALPHLSPRPDAEDYDGPVHASRCGDTSVHDPHQHGGGRWLCVGVDTPAPAPVDDREALAADIERGIQANYGLFVRGTNVWRLHLADHLIAAGYVKGGQA